MYIYIYIYIHTHIYIYTYICIHNVRYDSGMIHANTHSARSGVSKPAGAESMASRVYAQSSY